MTAMRDANGRLYCTERYQQRHTCGCRQCGMRYHCGKHDDGCHTQCVPRSPEAGFRRFVVYRPDEPDRPRLGPVRPDRPRFEGVQFGSGICVIHWPPPVRSTAVFGSVKLMMQAHGHPDYGGYLVWLDAPDEE